MSAIDATRNAGASEPAQRVLARLDGVRRSGQGWEALCPAHEDRNPSLSIAQGDDGRCLLYCQAGCGLADVLAACGLSERDLFPEQKHRRGGATAPEATYRYVDEEGELLYEVCRFPGKRFRQRRRDPGAPGGYRWSLGEVRRVLYRLPQVRAAVAARKRVYVPEAEKDVHAIEAAGATATCNPGGAGKWRAEYAQILRGADVVVVADRDEPGRAHAATVAASLTGIARTLSVVQARAGKDATDHLAAGHGLEDFDPVQAPATAQNNGTGQPYSETPDGLKWHRPTKTGGVEDVLLANFTAHIVTDTIVDDGSGETSHTFTIRARLHSGATRELDVPASAFAGMGWVVELGAEAVLWPGQGSRDRTRHAIQLLSDPRARRVYAHTGWIKLDGRDVWLHAGGGIAPNGPVEDVEVKLPRQLELLALPGALSGPELHRSIRASLDLLSLGPTEVTTPVLGAVYRAPLGSADQSVYIEGPTGAFKTELGALAQQHYGPGLDSRHLPGSWSSTGNSLEYLAFVAKDALLVVDDFAPGGSKQDVNRQHRDADRVLRAQGNNSSRGRMNADGTMRPDRPPRALMLSTGEDIPRGESLGARLVVVELRRGAIDPDALSIAQEHAADGLYAQAMAGYIQWLAGLGLDAVQRHLADRTRALRDSAIGDHRRGPSNIASLAAGLEMFLSYAITTGAIPVEDARAIWESSWLALMRAAAVQAQQQAEADPARHFLSLLAGAIVAGRAYLADSDGQPPGSAETWGWRQGQAAASQHLIGWVDDEQVYLDPQAAYLVAQRAAEDSAQPLSLSSRPLQRQLKDRGLILVGNERESRFTVRRSLGGVSNRRVLYLTPLATRALLGDDSDTGTPPRPAGVALPEIPRFLPVPGAHREAQMPKSHGGFR